MTGTGHLWKRPLDVALSFLLLVLASPALALVAVLVRLDSRGPVLFRQQRAGRNGVPFTMYKFRSMVHGSADDRHRQAAAAWFAGAPSETGGYKSRSDPRITRVGRMLRTLSIDELPQLFNVLKGDMSLVGPRPGLAYEREQYQDWYFEREAVRPGMTGLWQVSGRANLAAAEMMALDVEYVRTCSLWLDVKILVRTVPALLDT